LVIGLIALATMATGQPSSQQPTEQYEMRTAFLKAEGSFGQDLAAMDVAVTGGGVGIGIHGL